MEINKHLSDTMLGFNATIAELDAQATFTGALATSFAKFADLSYLPPLPAVLMLKFVPLRIPSLSNGDCITSRNFLCLVLLENFRLLEKDDIPC